MDYHYPYGDLAVDHIRVLTIVPMTDLATHVECKLKTVSLNSDYNALSYTWGDPNLTRDIMIDGNRFSATVNMYKALMRLRETLQACQPVQIWIDAICINQDNVTERNQQVGLMGDIYKGAKTVHIWLGEGTSRTPETFILLEKLSKWQSIWDLVPSDRIASAFEALTEVLSAAWWSRVWVVQEALLAFNPMLHCGDLSLRFNVVLDAGTRLRTDLVSDYATLQTHMDDEHIVQMRTLVQETTVVFTRLVISIKMRLARHNGDNWKMFEKLGHTDAEAITDALRLAQRANASDARDKVYGILGLLPRSFDLKPDYSRTLAEVHVDVALKLMEKTSSLVPLLDVGGDDTDNLPTWVPSWRMESPDIKLGSLNVTPEIDACGGLGCIYQYLGSGVLRVRGILAGCVTAISEPQNIVCSAVGNEALQKAIERWRSTHLPDHHPNLWQDNLAESYDEQAFWHSICQGICQEGRSHRRLCAADEPQLRELARFISTQPPEAFTSMVGGWTEDESKGVTEAISACFDHQMMLRTTDGSLGCGPKQTVVGDGVYVLAGSVWPIVLRRCNDGRSERYKVIGPCYLHGKSDVPLS